jgi:predicted nucleic acid-binding protein
MKQLTPDDWVTSRRLALDLAEGWHIVQPSNALRSNAEQLVERYDLKAADAMQLAAALYWCEDFPRGEVFLTADQKLREAAVLSGFDGKVI